MSSTPTTKLALLPLPKGEIYTADTFMTHLKGWWTPPTFVLQSWANGVYFSYSDEGDYQKKKDLILQSHKEAVDSFWSAMVY